MLTALNIGRPKPVRRKHAKVYRLVTWKPMETPLMASRTILTVAAICTATLAQADTFAERWPAPSAVDPVRVAQAPAAEPPEKVRQAFACRRIYFTKNKHRYWACKR